MVHENENKNRIDCDRHILVYNVCMGTDMYTWKLCDVSIDVLDACMDNYMVRYCNVLFVEIVMISN